MSANGKDGGGAGQNANGEATAEHEGGARFNRRLLIRRRCGGEWWSA